MSEVRRCWQCLICKKLYDTEVDAVICAESTEQQLFYPGAIVVEECATRPYPDTYCKWGWQDGDKRWIFRRGPALHDPPESTKGYAFYYVVTAVTRNSREPHRWCYHVATLGQKPTVKDGRTYYYSGWTSMGDHVTMMPAPNPPEAVVRGGAALVGLTFEQLL